MVRKTSRHEQKEFNNLPPMDPLAQKATDYLNAKGRLENVQADVDKVKAELVVEFIKAGKTQIKVSGHLVAYSHKESDSITAKEAL